MNFPALNTMRAYWEALREGRDMPARADIDPRGIENALEHAFIAERIAPGIARFRIAGMHLQELMGMEVKGMPLTALMEPETRTSFAADLERVFARPAIVEFALHSPAGFGRPGLDGRMLLLPLRGEDGAVSCALGGLAMAGKVGRAPRRVEPVQIRLTPVEAAQPAVDAKSPAPQASGFAEPPATFAPAAPAPRPYLRLVKSD